jgi:hypothetical protein
MTAGTSRMHADNDWRTGFDFAASTLAEEPQEAREAIARQFAQDQTKVPFGSSQYRALSGALAFLTQRHQEAS